MLASGGGTNLQALLDKLHLEEGFEIVAVASDKAEAQALERARKAGVDHEVFARAEGEDREARDAVMAGWLEQREPDLIVLAGYMQLLSPGFVERFSQRVINVHPALLPSFPGLEAVQQALDHGSKVTGVTVHFVDDGVDTGPIILQRAVTIPDSRIWDDTETLIHAAEHELLPEAIRLIAAGRVSLDPDNHRVVRISE